MTLAPLHLNNLPLCTTSAASSFCCSALFIGTPRAPSLRRFVSTRNAYKARSKSCPTSAETPQGGVTRLGFSETDLAAREYVTGLMRQAGLEVRVDPAGNIFGLRAGSEKLPTLLFGSHIDSVLHGGNFDGDVGSMGAIEVMRALNDERIKTRHPLEAVIWTNEEGNHFGIVRWVRVLRLGRLGLRFSKGKTSRG